MTRGVELILAGFLMVMLLPVMVFVGLAVLIIDGRPVLYRASRVGAGGRGFLMLKFRTMAGCSACGVTGGDKIARITPLGHILRRTRLDELPQIVNILRGDLGFVGPRPPAPEYVAAAPDLYAGVLATARPGITGLATLTFHRREEAILATGRTAAEVDRLYRCRCIRRKARIDLLYSRRRNLAMDIWLMGLTGLKVFGVSANRRLWRARPVPGIGALTWTPHVPVLGAPRAFATNNFAKFE